MLGTITTVSGPKQVHLGGWRRQKFDPRDFTYQLKSHPSLYGAATKTDLRPGASPVEDQGELGSCTAHMLAGLVEYEEKAKWAAAVQRAASVAQVLITNVATSAAGVITFNTVVTPASTPTPTPTPTPKSIRVSRLLEYYATRLIEGDVKDDTGASIRDTIKAAAKYGCADETLWPYDVTKFAINPPQSVWTAAALHKVTSYHSIADGDINTMKATLLGGSPIGFGFNVYDYMMSNQMASQGILSLPKANERLQGGHAVSLFGFDDSLKTADGVGAFLVRNSWGTGWGIGGYFWMSYQYVATTSLSSDFWTITASPFVS